MTTRAASFEADVEGRTSARINFGDYRLKDRRFEQF